MSTAIAARAMVTVVFAGMLAATTVACHSDEPTSAHLSDAVRHDLVALRDRIAQTPSGSLWWTAPTAAPTAATWLPAVSLLLVSGELTREEAVARLEDMIPLVAEPEIRPGVAGSALAAYALREDLGGTLDRFVRAIESGAGDRAPLIRPRLDVLAVDRTPSVSGANPLCARANEQITADPTGFSVTATMILTSADGLRTCDASGLPFAVTCDPVAVSQDLVLDLAAIYPARAGVLATSCLMGLIEAEVAVAPADGVAGQTAIQELGTYAWLIVALGIKATNSWKDAPVVQLAARVDRERGRSQYSPAPGTPSSLDQWIVARMLNSVAGTSFDVNRSVPPEADELRPRVPSAGCTEVLPTRVSLTAIDAAGPPGEMVARLGAQLADCHQVAVEIERPQALARAFVTVAASLTSCVASGRPGSVEARGGEAGSSVPADLVDDEFTIFALAFSKVPARFRCEVLGR